MRFLDKQSSIARPGYSRWLVPPSALAIHLSIGQAYAFSVFKIPLTQAIGVTKHINGVDWNQPRIAVVFSIAIVFLGLSAAIFGRWVEEVGPRTAMFAAALCFASGLMISGVGVHLHWLWLLYVGYGVIGGIGLGLGYIAPVSTLIRWFPDRPGLATGLSIMGLGGGAVIAAPLSNILMTHFRSSTSVGVAMTFITMGALYFCFMMFGVVTIRISPADWRPARWRAPRRRNTMITAYNVDVSTAWKTPQFRLLWLMFCLNAAAGIAVLEQASPMIQEMFKGTVTPIAAGGFVGLLSLFNMAGRFFWSATSDYIGRKNTFGVLLLLGACLYVTVAFTGHTHLNNIALFVLTCALIISMYGGGFATIPAYLRDLFGTMHVGAIHGRVLTAWSAAGVLGPMLVNYTRERQVQHGIDPVDAYSVILYIMAGMLVVGFICNALIRPVDEKYFRRGEGRGSLHTVPSAAG